ncbi:hypothetical protein QYF36_005049 [Acer negundo]|nr:hypothetical protein QYF36_005049 [Acer negundo]
MKLKIHAEKDSKNDGCAVCSDDFNNEDDDGSDIYNKSSFGDCDRDTSPNCQLPNKCENSENKSTTVNQVDFVVNSQQDFHIVAYGCTTCIGNSGELDESVASAISDNDIIAAAVNSGNRNFEGQVHPLTKANYLASPPLVVAYALAGTVTLSQQITFPSRKHPQRQSCCEVSASPWGGKKELQFLRHGNDEVLARGTFANIRLVNKLLNDEVGPKTIHIPTGEKLSVFDAAMRYKAAGHDTIVLAGADYGSGSSRDWAAKVPMLLGVKPVIAKSFERIHRSNLVGMGIIPLCFKSGQFADTLGLTGHERYTIDLQARLVR